MQKTTEKDKILRLIDANLNRVKEGLRVIEDIFRFIIDDKKLTAKYKKIRHELTISLKESRYFQPEMIIRERNIDNDVGKSSIRSESTRKDIPDIALANFQRVKESIRVLEEFSKLYDKKLSTRIKIIRYEIYSLEKLALEKISSLCHNRL